MASQPPILTDDDIMRVRSQQRRPAPPVMPPPQYQQPQGGYGRIVTGGPRVAPPVAPSQAVQDYSSANNSNASAARTQALTPEEVEALRLQNEQRRRELQGSSPQQMNQNDLSRQRADVEAMTNQLQTVGNLYNRNFRDNDPIVTLGLSPTEREFDRNAEILRQQAQSAFRVPGIGSQSDYEARQLEQAYGLSSTNWDTENEAVLNGLTNRLNERRRALGLEPVDWRQQHIQAVQQGGDPNRVQPGESMGQVGTVPNPVMAADPGQNQLDNSGGMYVTDADRRLGDQAAAHANAMIHAGATSAQVDAWLHSVGRPSMDAAVAQSIDSYRARGQSRRHPGFSPVYSPTGRSDPNLTTGMANTGYGAGVIAAGDALTFGTLDNMTADPERTRAGMEMLREAHPWESMAGEAAGSLVPGVGLERGVGYGLRALNEARGVGNVARGAGELRTIGEMATRPAGNFAYGAGYGAGSADQPGDNRALAALRGGAMSAVGGEVGDRFMAGVGRGLTGSRNAAVRALTERGVPLSIGQIASGGGRLARVATSVENALESVPWLGDAIRARRQDSFNGVNRAAFDEALAPIGANTGGVVGEEGAGLARSAVSDAYSKALDHVVVPVDANFGKELTGAISLGQRLPPDLQGHFRTFIENRVAPQIRQGQITGTGYQALRQEIRQELTAIRGQLGEREYGAAMKRVGDALERVVRRNAPDAVPALNAADRAYRQTRVVEGAVGRALNNKEQGGIFTPAQLGMEARANANRFGNNGGTTERPFYQLQRDAQNTLPSSLPNSGTTDRAWVLAAFPAIVSGGLGATGVIDPSTAALFAGLGLPYTRAGQRSFQKLLVSRPDAVRRTGEAIIARRRIGGRLGAGAVNPITDETPNPSGR